MVESEFRRLLDNGIELKVVGETSEEPLNLLTCGYTPKHKIALFDKTFYLTNSRITEDFKSFTAYVLHNEERTQKQTLHARLFYKDYSLIWRAASHFMAINGTIDWFGKGDVSYGKCGSIVESMEETTNLPLEMQSALDSLDKKNRNPKRDNRAAWLVLRQAPRYRVWPYREFTHPRQLIRQNRRNLINNGKRIAYLARKHDPTSGKFVKGYEPDFKCGVVEISHCNSVLYGGLVTKYRILSMNRQVQYQFIVSRGLVWSNPPQPTTTQLTSFGVRPVDVHHDEYMFIPGFEYHTVDNSTDPPTFDTQVPIGFEGDVCPVDDSKADTSPWLNKLPHIRSFRRQVLMRGVKIPNFDN